MGTREGVIEQTKISLGDEECDDKYIFLAISVSLAA
jgi:hypothetical protein